MQIANGLTAYRNVLLWACVVCIVTSAGCRRRVKTETTVGIDSPEQTWIRVLLFGNLRRCTVASENGFVVDDAQNGILAEFKTDKPMPILLLGRRILIGEHAFGSNIIIKPNDPHVFDIDGDRYRGHLRLQVRSDDSGMNVINLVPLESYLLGVVGSEMHSYWEPEALKAQAVAARTYCLFIQNRFGRHRQWDVSKHQSSQMYNGLKAETASIRQAVLDTAGQVLVCPHEKDGELIFPAYYSSSCGGHTEKAEYVFGRDGRQVPALRGVECPYCKDIAKQSDYHWKPVTLSLKQISDKLIERYPSLAKLDEIVDLEVSRYGYLDRITEIKLIGKNGRTDCLRGEDFRLTVDPTGRKLKSTLFKMKIKNGKAEFTNGRGFGHGVGMCQCGAQGMAREKHSYRQILDYYFPGSKCVTIRTTEE